MRNETEIFDTIIKVANEDENIQAVVLNGSRVEHSDIWEALYIMIKLFKETAISVANEFDFLYPEESENSILKHLEYLKSNLSL